MSFEEFLREHNVEVAPSGHEHSRAGWVNFDCPYCSPGWKHYRMGYNIRGHYVNCWACGRHKTYQVLAELTGITTGSAVKFLQGLGSDLPKYEKPKRGRLVLPKGIGPLSAAHREYLAERRFNYITLSKLWNLQGIGLSSKLPWRIFIPIFSQGSVVSWTTRSISDKHNQRYISASPDEEAIDHKSLIYGEDYVRYTIVVVEGPTDVWRIGPGAGCTFGTSFSLAQVSKIAEYPRRVVCYDSESDAQRSARKLCDALETFPGDTFNVVLDAKDPGESLTEAQEIRSRFLEV